MSKRTKTRAESRLWGYFIFYYLKKKKKNYGTNTNSKYALFSIQLPKYYCCLINSTLSPQKKKEKKKSYTWNFLS